MLLIQELKPKSKISLQGDHGVDYSYCGQRDKKENCHVRDANGLKTCCNMLALGGYNMA